MTKVVLDSARVFDVLVKPLVTGDQRQRLTQQGGGEARDGGKDGQHNRGEEPPS